LVAAGDGLDERDPLLLGDRGFRLATIEQIAECSHCAIPPVVGETWRTTEQSIRYSASLGRPSMSRPNVVFLSRQAAHGRMATASRTCSTIDRKRALIRSVGAPDLLE